MSQPRVILITGASSGIGKATALKLQAQGNIVYGAARRIEKMTDLAAAGVHVLKVDVTDEATLIAAVKTIQVEQGRIDVPNQQCGVWLIRFLGRRSGRRRRVPIQGQCLWCDAVDTISFTVDAGTTSWSDH